MSVKLTNNAVSTLAAAIGSGATSITVATGDGALFPTLAAGEWFPLTLTRLDSEGVGSGAFEIVRATGRSSDTITIVRAQEGTLALPFEAGHKVELLLTAGALDDLPGARGGDLSAADIDTLAELNAIVTDATLIDTTDSRLSDARDPTAHAATHVDGTDDIRSATNAQKGLATAAHISAIEANTAKDTNATHTGDVTGSTALTIANGAVSNAKLTDVATNTIKGRTTAGVGNPEDLTAAQARNLLNVEDGATADQSDAEIETAYNNQVPVMSQAEAEAGTSTAIRRVTAERIAQAIAALASGGTGGLSSADIDTLAELNAIVTDATLMDAAAAVLSGDLDASENALNNALRIQLTGQAAEYTADPGAFVDATADHTWNFAGGTLNNGRIVPQCINFTGVQTIKGGNGNAFLMSALFDFTATIKNDPGVANNLGPFYALNDGAAIEADGATITYFLHRSHRFSPVFRAVNGGTLTVTNAHAGFSQPAVRSGATLQNGSGWADLGPNVLAGGTANKWASFRSKKADADVGHASGLLIGFSAFNTPPDGNWAIYQGNGDERPYRYNSGQAHRVRTITADHTVTAADRTIIGGSGDLAVTFDDGVPDGLEVVLRNDTGNDMALVNNVGVNFTADIFTTMRAGEYQSLQYVDGISTWVKTGGTAVQEAIPPPLDGPFLSFTSSDPRIIERFTATSANDLGSMQASGDDITFNADGVQVGSVPSQATQQELFWPQSFVAANNLADGFTLQFEIEKAAFAEDIPGQAENRLLYLVAGSGLAFMMRHANRNNWRQFAGNTAEGVKTFDTAYRDHVVVTISWNPNLGSFGQFDMYADYFLVESFEATQTPAFDQSLNIMGKGESGLPNLTQRVKNVMLMSGPTILSTPKERVVVATGDSWWVFGQYQAGTDNQDDPPITGYTLDEYADGSQDADTDSKNRSIFAALHWELVNKDIYPKDNEIQFYGRSGTRVLPTGGKPLIERVDAVLGQDLSNDAPHFPTALGTATAQIWLLIVGLNDAGWYADGTNGSETRTLTAYVDDLITEYKAQLDRMIDDGAEKVVVCTAAPRYLPASPPTTEEFATTTQAINAAYRAELDDYRGKVVIAEIYNDYVPEFARDDGLHPNSTGQAFVAQKIGEVA